jgi:hypothetical protein
MSKINPSSLPQNVANTVQAYLLNNSSFYKIVPKLKNAFEGGFNPSKLGAAMWDALTGQLVLAVTLIDEVMLPFVKFMEAKSKN